MLAREKDCLVLIAEEVGRWMLGLMIFEEEERKLEIVVAMVEEEVLYLEEVGFISHMLNGIEGCLGGGGLVVVAERSSRVLKRAWGKVGGMENKSSMGSMLIAKGEECLDGWVGAGGREVKGGGVDFEVTKILLGEIPGESGGKEFGGEEFGVDGGAIL
ncbi:hypothetical protein Tco_1268171 [Tanacetum coccineum]